MVSTSALKVLGYGFDALPGCTKDCKNWYPSPLSILVGLSRWDHQSITAEDKFCILRDVTIIGTLTFIVMQNDTMEINHHHNNNGSMLRSLAIISALKITWFFLEITAGAEWCDIRATLTLFAFCFLAKSQMPCLCRASFQVKHHHSR